ncbi:AAA family ATPase [Emticicia agri]|uniref:ATPase AAA-type core domain-containing protein n=1 Tax=Emticicia agri TaxID=2492393 RepID=A0A4Q5M2N6_9BACT|nr:ATP-binding protein [Emticicia agri]RYU96548.1 hypothetical protein EWM59_06965 [Emticicia agri]
MKVRSLQLKHIGVFEDETISFPEKKDKDMAEIHILTGENGTGKTTILQALACALSTTNFDYSSISNDLLFTKRFRFENNKSLCIVSTSRGRIELQKNEDTLIPSGIDDYHLNEEKEDFGINKIPAFAYSGYRFVNSDLRTNIKEIPNYNPLVKALDFNKIYYENDYSINQWLANTISKRNNARNRNEKEKIKKFEENIKSLEFVIGEIINQDIEFVLNTENLNVMVLIKKTNKEFEFDVLPDGLRSLISWIGDLLMRIDNIKWKTDLLLSDKPIILLLDEIEVHLHPAWQRKVLPVVQKLFKNAQIFITTHSPFIVNSVDGAYIYELKLNESGYCKVKERTSSSTSKPIDEVLNEIYDIEISQMYGLPVEKEIENFHRIIEKAYKKDVSFDKKDLLKKAKRLALKSPELQNRVQFELRQLSRNLADDFSI